MIENALNFPILSALVLIPILGAICLLFVESKHKYFIKVFTLFITSLNFFVSIILPFNFDTTTHKMQFVESLDWLPGIGSQYLVGIDGISLVLILLAALLMIVAVLCSWTAVTTKIKEYMIFMLLLEAGMIGVFISLDLIVFYLFWEISLVPMYFLIGLWGGPRRLYANIKFFLYTLTGSIFMLIGILAIYFAHGSATGEYTFSLIKLYEFVYPYNLQWWVFLAFFLGFAIKVPIFPLHTWLPDAHVEAPTAGSVMLAGILLKMGTYGFVRFNLPLFPDASNYFAPYILVLAVIGIVYGALLALAQKDMKKLVAYSSVSHLGFVMAGLFVMNQEGMDGAVLQMINHGISSGGLFLIVGMIYERRHTRMMDDFGGLFKVMPIYTILATVIVFSSFGMPGTNGFIGEILILVGMFKSNVIAASISIIGVILGAAYMLGMYQKVMLGKLDKPENKLLKDLNGREILILVPIIALILFIGLYPKPVLSAFKASTTHLVDLVNRKAIKSHQDLVHELDTVKATIKHKAMETPETGEITTEGTKIEKNPHDNRSHKDSHYNESSPHQGGSIGDE